MKSPLTTASFRSAQLALGLCAAIVVAAAALAAVSPSPWADLLRTALAPLCHQLPERSFALGGFSMGLCHRCTAVLLALAIVLILPTGRRRWLAPGGLLTIAVLPLVVDWGLDAAGLWENTAATRVITGAWAGIVLGLLIGTAAGPPSTATRS